MTKQKMFLRAGSGDHEEAYLEEIEGGWRFSIGGREYEIDASGDPRDLSFVVEGRQREVAVSRQGERAGADRYSVSIGGRTVDVEVLDPLAMLAAESRGGSGAGGSARVEAYMPGRVVKILVSEGDTVEAGQGILVLEAMKMENEIATEQAGVVSSVLVEEGQAVDGGDPLFEITPN